MDPVELEYLAESELVTIIPRIRMETLDLLETKPNIATEVPFWVALYLRQQQKCRIIPPTWLSVTRLLEFKEAEDGEAGCTVPPHPHYAEVATLILQYALEDIQSHEQVRTLVKDLWDTRVGKFVSSVNSFVLSGASTAKVSQLTPLELASARNLLTNSLDQLSTIRSLRYRANVSSDLSRSIVSQTDF